MACSAGDDETVQSERFPATAEGARAARHFTRLAVRSAGEVADTAELVVSEIATNVVRHARTTFSVEIVHLADRVRLVVRDGYAVDLRVTAADGDAESGRGLAIVDALAHRWGVDRDHDGKCVWVELLLS